MPSSWKSKEVKLSMEARKIVEGQRCTKGLNERQITALLKVTYRGPRDRENDILQDLQSFDQETVSDLASLGNGMANQVGCQLQSYSAVNQGNFLLQSQSTAN